MEVRLFVRDDGRCPYREWLAEVGDATVRRRIRARVDRLLLGNLGDIRSLGGGLHELRIQLGPGYRIYCTVRGGILVILLCGGDKATQERDMRRARDYLAELEAQDG